MKVTETLEMYRYPRTVQLEILQMYRMDYLLQGHINSAVREVTRECVSKWIVLCGVGDQLVQDHLGLQPNGSWLIS